MLMHGCGKRAWVLLQVDYTGYSTIHLQRFGSRFVNRVANPNDILLFTKSAQR
jgi:double-strand break repair protein MRE11